MTYIITGAKNEGKTWTQKLITDILKNKIEIAQELRRPKVVMDGFICKKFFLPQAIPLSKVHENNREIDNHHIGYDLTRISNNKSIPFIRLIENADPDLGEGLHYGPFIFFNNGITEGKIILRECYNNKTKNVIIDEIGKLEIDGKIFADEVQQLIKYSDIINLFISVRTEFLKPIVEKFGIKNYKIIQTDFSEKEIKDILKNIYLMNL